MRVSSFTKDVALNSKNWKMPGFVIVMETIVTILPAQLELQ